MARGWAVAITGEYPEEWINGNIQKHIYKKASYRCENCSMVFNWGTTIATTAKRKDGKPYILTVHHLDGNKANCSDENLIALCQKCHLHIQATWSPGQAIPAAWGSVPGWLIARNLPYKIAEFQLSLI